MPARKHDEETGATAYNTRSMAIAEWLYSVEKVAATACVRDRWAQLNGALNK